MVLGRFSGDSLAHKFGTKNLIIVSGLLAGLGLTVGLLIGGYFGVLLAWFLLGIGLSVVIPMMFSAAGTIADTQYKSIISNENTSDSLHHKLNDIEKHLKFTLLYIILFLIIKYINILYLLVIIILK